MDLCGLCHGTLWRLSLESILELLPVTINIQIFICLQFVEHIVDSNFNTAAFSSSFTLMVN